MLFAGFNVSEGQYSLLAVTLVGTVANLVGSWIAYAVGYYGRIDILEKHGRKLHIKPSHLEWADRWFERHGDATVFFTRMLPVIRTFISLPAGVARMPFWRFTAFTRRRLPAVGVPARLHRQAGRGELGGVEGQPALRRLRGRRGRSSSASCSSSSAAGATASARARPRRMRPAPDAHPGPKLSHALALGALHGPAELLPVSSSAHTTLVPWLLGWSYPDLDPELRKAFEVALHAGTAAALLVGLRDEVADAARGLRPAPPDARGRLVRPAGDRRLHARAADRAAARHAADDRGRARRRGGGDVDRRRALAAAARADGRRRGRRPRARPRPGVRARARRLAQRRDADRRPRARLPAGGRERAVAPRRAAGDRRRDPAEGRAPGAARPARRRGRVVRGRDRRRVRLDAAVGAADPRRRARPLARPVRRLPPRARRARVARAARSR